MSLCCILLGAVLALLVFVLAWVYALFQKNREKSRRLRRLEEIASIDSLTLIYNRHMLDDFLKKQISAAERYRQLFSLIFFDIDAFKKVNDRFGHNVGDEVLIDLALIVSRSMRESDIFGRWGGDEFLIILPENIQKQAIRLVQILEERIEAHTFPKVKHVSCSFGVVSYRFGDTPKEIMRRADEKLYDAKRARANSSISASSHSKSLH